MTGAGGAGLRTRGAPGDNGKGMDFDPLAPEMLEDPYPTYRRLREEHPAFYSERHRTWVLSRYDDVRAALLDPELYCSGRGVLLGAGSEVLLPMVQTTDPPAHAPLRALIGQAFLRRQVEPLEEALRELATELIDGFVERGACDFTSEFAWPFPANVICELMGVPEEDREPFREWSHRLSIGDVGAARSIYGYFGGLIERRRRCPADDLVSALIAARVEGEALASEQLLGACFQLVIAGHETTTNLLGNAMVLLARRPGLRERLAAEPGLLPLAIEEILRFDPPVQGLSRTLTRDVELHGEKLASGAKVHLLFAAANRDGRVFVEPDALVAERRPNPHLSFGLGIHFCAGAHLARLETRIALEELLTRLPELALREERVARLPSPILRGPETLPITFCPGPRRS